MTLWSQDTCTTNRWQWRQRPVDAVALTGNAVEADDERPGRVLAIKGTLVLTLARAFDLAVYVADWENACLGVSPLLLAVCVAG